MLIVGSFHTTDLAEMDKDSFPKVARKVKLAHFMQPIMSVMEFVTRDVCIAAKLRCKW